VFYLAVSFGFGVICYGRIQSIAHRACNLRDIQIETFRQLLRSGGLTCSAAHCGNAAYADKFHDFYPHNFDTGLMAKHFGSDHASRLYGE
jgi:hypothetical protein